MAQGEVVERGTTADVFAHPTHEYTRQLLSSIPGRALLAASSAG
jgi:ABC-type dipeptide/oligopeptide/nickel transport system ATPase component